MLSSELYAMSQEARCEGDKQCHWCAAPCKRVFLHDDSPRMIGVKPSQVSKKPDSSYICMGCWLFRRKRTTVYFLSGEYKDGQKSCDHSLLILENGAWSVSKPDYIRLYEILLQPPLRFTLALLDGTGNINHLQLLKCNDNEEIKADTPLHFTINNIAHCYTVYELKIALRNGNVGVDPGTQALVRILGDYPMPEKERKRGRPPVKDGEGRELDQVLVRKSG